MACAKTIAETLTLSGLGMIMWLGIGAPTVSGRLILMVCAAAVVLSLSRPFLDLLTTPKKAIQTLRDDLGTPALIALPVTLLALMLFAERWHIHTQMEDLGKVATLSATFTVISIARHKARQTELKTTGTLLSGLIALGFAGTMGALIAGLVQFAMVSLTGLALLILLERFQRRKALTTQFGFGIVLLIIVPMTMMLTLKIGHLLAVPLILSNFAGQVILTRETDRA